MKTRLINFWDALRGSYWFVPSLMSLGAILLSVGCLNLDQHLNFRGAEKVPWLWAGGASGARSILSTIAGSMITVAGVVFSITIVALTLASSQFGPRLLRNFVRDAVNQVVLGTFIATYLYCLLVLREVKDVSDEAFVPYFSVTMAIALTAASLGMLIFFIHHVALSIQAENMVASVAAELRGSIVALFPEKAGTGKSVRRDEEAERRFEAGNPAKVVSDRAGYVQAIEVEELMEVARESDIVMRLLKRPGEFVFEGGVLAELLPAGKGDEELRARVRERHLIEARRTPRQDAEYCVDQLVEIAVRALSPGINDPFTAMACIRWLGDAMSRAAGQEIPDSHRYDEEGVLRMVAKVATFAGLVDAAFNAIRQYGVSNPSVALCLLETLEQIIPHVVREEDLRVLALHAEMTARDALAARPDEHEVSEIKGRFGRVHAALASACQSAGAAS